MEGAVLERAVRVRPLEERDLDEAVEIVWEISASAENPRSRAHRLLSARYNPRRYVAEVDGRIAAYGGVFLDTWMVPCHRAELDVWVRSDYRRRGIGSQLSDRLLADCRELSVTSVQARVYAEQAQALAFLKKRNFDELQRCWNLVLEPTRADVEEFRAQVRQVEGRGLKLTTLAREREQSPRYAEQFHRLWVDVCIDQPGHDPAQTPPFEPFVRWLEQPARLLDGCFIAGDGERYVGGCMLQQRPDTPDQLLQNFTGVLREYRRCGIATALKVKAIEYARARGYTRIVTRNDTANDAMLQLNERLGFYRVDGLVTLIRSLEV
jgi:mycothiol synthase